MEDLKKIRRTSRDSVQEITEEEIILKNGNKIKLDKSLKGVDEIRLEK